MRRAQAIGGALLVLGTLTLASQAAPGALTGCAPSPARPLVVTNFSDNVQHPAKGTLRRILLDVAKPGQEITFCDTTPIDLAGSLTIPEADRDVRISGGSISSPELRPAAFVIQADGLRITGTSFYETRVVVMAKDVALSGDSFRQRRTDEPYVLIAEGAPGLTLGGTGSAADTFESHAETAIAIQKSSDVRIVGNTITTGGGGRFALEGDSDSGLVFDDNTTDGDIITLASSGSVSGNTLNGSGSSSGGGSSGQPYAVASGANLSPAQAVAAARRAGRGLYLLTGGALPVGHLEVAHNHVDNAGLDVERPDVTIGGNVVTGGSGMGITCGHPDEPSRAPITITGNTLNGTEDGLRYRCSAPVKAELAGNTVMSGKRYGIYVNAAQAILTGNKVQMNRQRGIDLNCQSTPTGSFELDKNVVSANKTGITITCGVPGVASKLDDNTVDDNRGNGIVVARSGDGTSITGGKVQGNRGVGITIYPGAHASVSRVATGANSGLGIQSSAVPPPVLNYSDKAVHGRTCAGCLVQAFTIEGGGRQGNPHNGEGAAYVGAVQADATGRFVYPARCQEALQLTFTATSGTGANADTSGFSADVVCAAVETYRYAVHIAVTGATAHWSVTDPQSGYRDTGSVESSWELSAPDVAITVDASNKAACNCANGSAPQYPVTGTATGTLTQSGKAALGPVNTSCNWNLDTSAPDTAVLPMVGDDTAAGKPTAVQHGYEHTGELAVDVIPQGYVPVLESCQGGTASRSSLLPAQVFLGADGCSGAADDTFVPFVVPIADLGKATIKLPRVPFPADTASCALRGYSLTTGGASAHFSGSFDVTLTLLPSRP